MENNTTTKCICTHSIVAVAAFCAPIVTELNGLLLHGYNFALVTLDNRLPEITKKNNHCVTIFSLRSEVLY